MKLKIYKPVLTLGVLLAFCITAVAQPAGSVPPVAPMAPVNVLSPVSVNTNIQVNLKHLDATLVKLNTKTAPQLKTLSKTISKTFANFNIEFSKSMDILGRELSAINCDCDVNVNVNDEVKAEAVTGDMEELTKTYSKSYPVDANDILDIDNRYGKVTVVTWNKNEFKVDVLIKVATNKESAAKKMLDGVTIQDGKQGSTIWFKTRFASDQGSGSWSFNGKKTVRIMEINYTIHMPAKNALSVTNKYGSTELPDLYGRVVVNAAYGNLTAKNLPNPANDINVKYGSASIEGLSGCDLNVAYGNLSLNESEKVNANVSYGAAKIGNVKTSGVFNVKYSGGLNIAAVDKNLKNLVVNSSYSAVKVSLLETLNLDFDVTVHYGNFNYSNAINVINNDENDDKGWKPTKNFKGSVGKGNIDKVIVIKSNYGNVAFE